MLHMADREKEKKGEWWRGLAKGCRTCMFTVEMLCISISNGPMSFGAGPDWESLDCIHCIVCWWCIAPLTHAPSLPLVSPSRLRMWYCRCLLYDMERAWVSMSLQDSSRPVRLSHQNKKSSYWKRSCPSVPGAPSIQAGADMTWIGNSSEELSQSSI